MYSGKRLFDRISDITEFEKDMTMEYNVRKKEMQESASMFRIFSLNILQMFLLWKTEAENSWSGKMVKANK